MVVFHIRLKALREEAGYRSQQAFADSFGVAQSTVAGWESGKREPNFETVIKLADFFDVTIDYLLGRKKIVVQDIKITPTNHDKVGMLKSGNIKKAREAAGYSQKQVALTLKVAAPSVSHWESGKTNPTAENLLALANLYGVSIDYLLGREGSPMNRIASLRNERKLSQKELGAIIGVAQNTICNWEKGNREPDHASLVKMACYFNCSTDYILGRTPVSSVRTMSGDPDNECDYPSSAEDELLAGYRRLNNKGQEKVLSYVSDLIQTGIYKSNDQSGKASEKT